MNVDQRIINGVILIFIILSGGTLVLRETMDNPDYDVCRKGTFGEWISISEVTYVSDFAPELGQYNCDIENKTRWCRKTTTTRCYYLDENLISGINNDYELEIEEGKWKLKIGDIEIESESKFNIYDTNPIKWKHNTSGYNLRMFDNPFIKFGYKYCDSLKFDSIGKGIQSKRNYTDCIDFSPNYMNSTGGIYRRSDLVNFTELDSKTILVEFYANSTFEYDPTITESVSSSFCTDNVCNGMAVVGDKLYLKGNSSVKALWIFENGLEDLSDSQLDLTVGALSANYESMTTERGDTVVGYNFTSDNSENNYLTFDIVAGSNFNFTTNAGNTIAMSFNISESEIDNQGRIISFDDAGGLNQHEIIIEDDSLGGNILIKSESNNPSCSRTNNDNINQQLGRQNKYTAYGFRVDLPDIFYYNVSGEEGSDGLHCEIQTPVTTAYIGRWWSSQRFETSVTLNYLMYYDGLLTVNQVLNCLTSKHCGPFVNDGNVTQNFTFAESGDTVAVSFVVEDTDEQASVCFKVEQETSSPWRCSNTTDISLSASFSEVNVTFMLNITNSSKTPVLIQNNVSLSSGANTAPTITNEEPTNDTSIINTTSVTHNITYTDADSDAGTVLFTINGFLVCTNSSVASGTVVRCRNESMIAGPYTWNVSASDGTDITYSGIFNYTINASEVVGNPDINWTVYNGTVWQNSKDFFTDFVVTFRALISTTENEPADQNAGSNICLFRVHNNGTATGDVKLGLNRTLVGQTILADDDNSYAGATNISKTTLTTISSSLIAGNSIDICLWADYDANVEGAQYDYNVTIE